MPIILDGTNGETFPSWTTAGRPSPAATGQTGYNTTLNVLETYNGTAWEVSSVPAPTTTGNVLFTSNGTNWSSTAKIVRDTAQASTSGTSIDFTGIPSWVKRITIMFSGVSTNGTSIVQVQIGSGSVTTTGYLSSAWSGGSGNTGSFLITGFCIDDTSSASSVRTGHLVLTNISGNTWIGSGTLARQPGVNDIVIALGGSVSLLGTLDRVRITTVLGADLFDAGSINILYE